MVYTTHLWWVCGWFNIVLTTLCIFSGSTNWVTASKSLDYLWFTDLNSANMPSCRWWFLNISRYLVLHFPKGYDEAFQGNILVASRFFSLQVRFADVEFQLVPFFLGKIHAVSNNENKACMPSDISTKKWKTAQSQLPIDPMQYPVNSVN